MTIGDIAGSEMVYVNDMGSENQNVNGHHRHTPLTNLHNFHTGQVNQ
jgi:hypothetical protein